MPCGISLDSSSIHLALCQSLWAWMVFLWEINLILLFYGCFLGGPYTCQAYTFLVCILPSHPQALFLYNSSFSRVKFRGKCSTFINSCPYLTILFITSFIFPYHTWCLGIMFWDGLVSYEYQKWNLYWWYAVQSNFPHTISPTQCRTFLSLLGFPIPGGVQDLHCGEKSLLTGDGEHMWCPKLNLCWHVHGKLIKPCPISSPFYL